MVLRWATAKKSDDISGLWPVRASCFALFCYCVCLIGLKGLLFCLFVRVTDLVSFNSLEAKAKRGGMADPSGLVCLFVCFVSVVE